MKAKADITINTKTFCHFRDMTNESRIAFQKMKDNRSGIIDIQHYDYRAKNWIAFDKDGYAMIKYKFHESALKAFRQMKYDSESYDKVYTLSYAKIGIIEVLTSRGKTIRYRAWIKCDKKDAFKIGD
jgi:hypothetical protein